MEKAREREILGAFAQFIKDVVEAGWRFIGAIVPLGTTSGEPEVRVIDCQPALVDRKGAAAYLGVGLTTLNEWTQSGEITPALMVGRSPRYKVSDLDRYIARKSKSK